MFKGIPNTLQKINFETKEIISNNFIYNINGNTTKLKLINGDEIVKEKQLAMLVLKNLRPREYENLLNNNGTIYNIINKISTALVRRDKKIALFPLWQEKSCFIMCFLLLC